MDSDGTLSMIAGETIVSFPPGPQTSRFGTCVPGSAARSRADAAPAHQEIYPSVSAGLGGGERPFSAAFAAAARRLISSSVIMID